jgi:hypothetical protein
MLAAQCVSMTVYWGRKDKFHTPLGTLFVVAFKTRISLYNDTLVHAMKVYGWRGSIVPHIPSTRMYVCVTNILLVFALSVLRTLEHFFMGLVHGNMC